MAPSLDIFISYSHRDNFPDGVLDTCWVSDLHRAVEERVSKLLGRDVVAWRDPRMKGNEPVGEAIDRRLAEAAALLCVISPSYVASDWCRREIESFVDACRKQRMETVNGLTRFFKVLKTPVERDLHPPAVADLVGYEFYSYDPETGYPEELQRAFGNEVQVQYWQRLNRLAHEITELLRAIAGAAAESAPGRPVVYLAETTDDLKVARETVHTDLLSKGCRVLPDRALNLMDAALGEALDAWLSASDLSVHLVGARSGGPAGDPSRSLVRAQLEAAGRHTDLRRILWLPSAPASNDPSRADFVGRLRTGSELGPGDDLVEGSLDKLRLAIDRTAVTGQKAARGPRAGGEVRRRVYLICDTLDVEGLTPLSEALFARGLEVIIPAFEGDESEVRLDDQENLKTCDAVLLYWGAGSELWRRRRQRDLDKSWGFGRTKPLLAVAVYLASPDRPEKRSFRTHEALVISAFHGGGSDTLEPFFDQISKRPARQSQ
jgi:hypothetical protein